MESLNMSKLNLSSVRSHAPNENCLKSDIADSKYESISLLIDNKYQCEYREEIWQNLLEQDAERPTIHLQSPQLEFRGALVQQLRAVSKQLGLCIGTLHSAVALLDLFMDAHRLRADRLTHVALACLSLAAKNEEKLSRAPTVKSLCKASGVSLCGRTFGQVEWMVGQHARWRLLAPTPASFAALLAEWLVTDEDLTTRHPTFLRRFRRDAAKLLEEYLDLTLSDVRLKVLESDVVGCACVSCARAALGLAAWPAWLARRARASTDRVAPLARLLHRMMQIKRRERLECDIEGYESSASGSPRCHLSPVTCQPTCLTDPSCRQINLHERFEIPLQSDFRVCRASRLIEASVEPASSLAVKRARGEERGGDVERKRYRLAPHQHGHGHGHYSQPVQ